MCRRLACLCSWGWAQVAGIVRAAGLGCRKAGTRWGQLAA